MSDFDRNKWNNRYGQQTPAGPGEASSLLELARPLWKPGGRGLDIAGGLGRNAQYLAKNGLRVTLADVSAVALSYAQEFARAAELEITCLEIDLETALFPAGPWDVISQVCFLNRKLFPKFVQALAPGGLLIIAQPTARNLERHEKPPRPFVLEEGELPTLVTGLQIEHYLEDWLDEGRHEAHLIARKPAG